MDVAAVMGPEGGLLQAARQVLSAADEAIVCVAFAQSRGVHLVSDELKALSKRGGGRVVVTTVFGSTTTAALTALKETRVDLRVLNPGSGGTYHPKVFLGRRGREVQALVGSCNLTSGLVANIEAATWMSGTVDDRPLRDLWRWAEQTWEHPYARTWHEVGETAEEVIDAELYELLVASAQVDPNVYTLGATPARNVIQDVARSGVWVHSDRSRERGSGAQLVSPRMLNLAWDALRARGQLTNRELLHELRVHRSSFVCAMLARLPGVSVVPGRLITLRYRAD